MRKIILLLVLAFCTVSVQASEVKNLSADEALAKLKNGNEHFLKYHMQHPDESRHRRKEMLKGQHPFVAILSCSDSRVPSEIIFDQGLGDIFVIRNAGNVLDEHVIGSIEYAVLHLGIKLVVVMGHQECGAVKATMEGHEDTRFIESLKKSINPAIELCKKQGNYSYENVIKTHARLDVENILKEDSQLKDYIKNHDVKIVPAYYHMDSGRVEFFVP